MLYALFSILAPVVLTAGVGFVWTKLGKPFDTDFVSTLNFNVTTPCLVFSSLTKLKLDPVAVGEVALAAVVATAILAVAGAIVLLALRIPLRPYLVPVISPNTGNTGLPVCYLAFGDAGLAFAVVAHGVTALVQFTAGVGITAGRVTYKDVLHVPLLYALAAALVVSLFEIPLPAWIANTAALIGQLAIPLMLIAMGASLTRLRVAQLGRSGTVAAIRLGLGLAAGIATAAAFGLDHVQAGVLILQISMPAAVFSYLLAVRYKADPDGMAGAIFVSTLAGFVALPFILYFVLQ
jgi:predicted permease